MARARIEGKTEADIDSCVAQLRKEKGYLFGGDRAQIVVPRKTAAAKDRVTHNQAVLEQAAKRAARTRQPRRPAAVPELRRSVM